MLKTISRYNMLPPGSRVLVAVSGGADSVCLLHVLREIAPQSLAGVAHFNHQWRAEASDEDERFVAALASEFALPFFRAGAKTAPGNLEQNARRDRLKFFTGLGTTVALGHTRDDQAETVLFRFLRGSGLAGLAGIAPTSNGIIRPLLDITRAEVESFLRSRKIPWRDDATNLDPTFARNRIRRDLLPQLAHDWNPQITDALARLADLAHEEEKYWQSEIDKIDLVIHANGVELKANLIVSPAEAHLGLCGAGCQPADRLPIGPSGRSPDATPQLPRALARRLIRRAITLAKGDLRRIDHHHIEAVLNIHRTVTLPGVTVTKSFDWLQFASPTPIVKPVPREIILPGVYPSPDALTQICVEVAQSDPCARLEMEECSLQLRGWQPGDHYRPQGHSGDHKIQEMFQKARIPCWRRASWPILACGAKIVWSRQFGLAEDFRGVLAIREITDK
ncbi:MAG: tRNA lysidine(34) synthetase TilS [Bryobacteraceae bacterium]